MTPGGARRAPGHRPGVGPPHRGLLGNRGRGPGASAAPAMRGSPDQALPPLRSSDAQRARTRSRRSPSSDPEFLSTTGIAWRFRSARAGCTGPAAFGAAPAPDQCAMRGATKLAPADGAVRSAGGGGLRSFMYEKLGANQRAWSMVAECVGKITVSEQLLRVKRWGICLTESR